ncbi:MAG: CoA transferase [Hyphomicrobiaceae bacterium]|nr:MAG: CoA transferase [Hyphomicrobiaceae bacterium]
MTKPLAGTLVVSLDQVVAAPLAARRLADAGARVIKLERPQGDAARGYDRIVHGESAYFVWLNRGKESVVIDLKRDADRRLFEALIAKADIFIQNLKPGALTSLDYPIDALRTRNPGLICCSISGYGDGGPYADRKAYDLLIQAESGLASVTGGPEAPARVGVSIVDIATGLHAYEAILEALIARGRTGQGADIRVSMFDTTIELMAVPLLHAAHGHPPKRMGFAHPSLAPYGVFQSSDGQPILISIQNDREWAVLCHKVLGEPELVVDPRFADATARATNRKETDGVVARCFAERDIATLCRQLEAAGIAFARVNDVTEVLQHPHLRRVSVGSETGPIELPAPPARMADQDERFGPIPVLGQHTEAVRREFLR